jgi:glycosyltransferase involved in cell wall biosynthesis
VADPIISIIIPSYNRAELLAATIESIQAQSFQDWELLIVDDGSTDHAFDMALKYQRGDLRINVHRRPDTVLKGANGCRNYGFTLSKGKYIKWVDSDDLLPKEALALQLQPLEIDKALEVCFGQGVFFNNETGNLEERWSRKIESRDILWDYIRNQIRWPVGGPLWRKSFFTIPPFESTLKNSQEWLMHGQQLLKLTASQYLILPDTVYLIRRGNERMSSYRNSRYFVNQARSRQLLLLSRSKAPVGFKFKAELVKQMMIFYYHALYRRFKGH